MADRAKQHALYCLFLPSNRTAALHNSLELHSTCAAETRACGQSTQHCEQILAALEPGAGHAGSAPGYTAVAW